MNSNIKVLRGENFFCKARRAGPFNSSKSYKMEVLEACGSTTTSNHLVYKHTSFIVSLIHKVAAISLIYIKDYHTL